MPSDPSIDCAPGPDGDRPLLLLGPVRLHRLELPQLHHRGDERPGETTFFFFEYVLIYLPLRKILYWTFYKQIEHSLLQ